MTHNLSDNERALANARTQEVNAWFDMRHDDFAKWKAEVIRLEWVCR